MHKVSVGPESVSQDSYSSNVPLQQERQLWAIEEQNPAVSRRRQFSQSLSQSWDCHSLAKWMATGSTQKTQVCLMEAGEQLGLKQSS